jgi:hypothetical protein
MTEKVILFSSNTDENKVLIPADVNKDIAENYAPQRQKNARFYAARRGGAPPSLFDSWYYKCAEYAVASFLHEKYNLPFVKPDTKIYSGKQKSWNCDLPYSDVKFLGRKHKELRIHCKSATIKSIAKGYKESFCFQLANKEGTGGTDAILKEGDENDYCVFVHVPYNDIVEGDINFHIRSVISWNFIKNNSLLENPIKKELIGCKYFVYTESLNNALATLV